MTALTVTRTKHVVLREGYAVMYAVTVKPNRPAEKADATDTPPVALTATRVEPLKEYWTGLSDVGKASCATRFVGFPCESVNDSADPTGMVSFTVA